MAESCPDFLSIPPQLSLQQESGRQRLAEQRERERDAIRWQWRLQQGDEEEIRRQHEQRYMQQEEGRRRREERRRQQQEKEREQHPQAEEIRQWLERHRQRQKGESGRMEELAEHTSQRRRQARRTRQEVDSLTPEYESLFSAKTSLRHQRPNTCQKTSSTKTK